MIIVSIDSYFFCFAYREATIACPSLLISLNRIIKSHWTFAHVVVGWTVSYLPLKEFGKYCSLWQFVYSPLITHTFINYQMCKTRSSLSWYLGNCIHNTFAKGTTIMGGTFIINATIVGGNFEKTLVLMCLGLFKNNLNNFLAYTLLIVLLLLASFVASFFDHFLGICGHPSFVIQLNIPKTLIVAFGLLVI